MARYKLNPVKRRFVTLYKNLVRRKCPLANEWFHSKSTFVNWCIEQDPPDDGYYLKRIDLNKPYGPDNCEFSLLKDKYRQLSCNKWFKYKGKQMILADLIKQYSVVSRAAFLDRLSRGFTIKEALTKPSRKKNKKPINEQKTNKRRRKLSRKDEIIFYQELKELLQAARMEAKFMRVQLKKWELVADEARAACA